MVEFDEAAFVAARENGTPAEEFTPPVGEIVETAPVIEAVSPSAPPETSPPEAVIPPVVEETTTEPVKPIEVIKEVEKIVDRYPEFKNEKSKAIYERLINAEDPKEAEKEVLNYLREKQRDYSVMSDLDVVKAALRQENPTWSKDDVDLKVRRIYGKNLTTIDLKTIDADIDPDKYQAAIGHNEEVEGALADIRLDALQKRPLLLQHQQELELPTIPQKNVTPQSGPTQEQVDEANRNWLTAVEAVLPTISDIKQTIDDKEVVYALNDADKKALGDTIKNFNLAAFSKEQGWVKEDGTPDIRKLAEDVLWLKNKVQISKSFATQIKTDTTKDLLKTIKNVDGSNRAPVNTDIGSLEEAYLATRN